MTAFVEVLVGEGASAPGAVAQHANGYQCELGHPAGTAMRRTEAVRLTGSDIVGASRSRDKPSIPNPPNSGWSACG